MAAKVTWSAIHLGTLPDIDTAEWDNDAEDPGALIRTYGSEADRLARHVTTITSDSDRDDTVSFDHSAGTEYIRYDIGGGEVTTQIDSGAQVEGTITFTDGTTLTTSLAVIQDTQGNLFLLISDSQPALAAKPIQSLTIDSVQRTNYDAAEQLTRDALEFVCFAPGTLIGTPVGERPVEALRAGDPVSTEDRGARPLAWVGRRRLVFGRAPHRQKPVLVPAGALAPGVPGRDLVMSPQHRVLLGGPAVRERHGLAEALGPVKGLIGRRGIRQMRGRREVTYVTLLFDRHEVIRAEGARVESFLPGPYALSLLDAGQREAVLRLFPRLRLDPGAYGTPARRLLTRRQVEALPECTRAVQARTPDKSSGCNLARDKDRERRHLFSATAAS